MLTNKLLTSRGSSKPPIGVTFLTTAADAASRTNYTFGGALNIGTAFTGRIIVVCISAFTASASNRFVSSVTVGGVAATALHNTRSPGNNTIAAIYAARLDTGTTATIAVGFNSSPDNCGIGLFSLSNALGYSSSIQPTAYTSSTASSYTITHPTVTAGDAIITCARIRSANVGTYSVTGATENYESDVEAGQSAQYGASTLITSGQSNYNIVLSTSGSSPVTNPASVRFFVP
jgi:hypothetical protein